MEARKSPKTFMQGYTRDAFDFRAPFDLFIGSNCFTDVCCVVRKSTGDEWFSIEAPEDVDAPPRLSAKFFAPKGQVELEICQNEWRCSAGVWDMQVSGPIIEVRTEYNKVMLRLKARPPHGLEIQYLDMIFQDTGISIDKYGTVLLKVSGTQIQMKGSDINSADAVFNVP